MNEPSRSAFLTLACNRSLSSDRFWYWTRSWSLSAVWLARSLDSWFTSLLSESREKRTETQATIAASSQLLFCFLPLFSLWILTQCTEPCDCSQQEETQHSQTNRSHFKRWLGFSFLSGHCKKVTDECNRLPHVQSCYIMSCNCIATIIIH